MEWGGALRHSLFPRWLGWAVTATLGSACGTMWCEWQGLCPKTMGHRDLGVRTPSMLQTTKVTFESECEMPMGPVAT